MVSSRKEGNFMIQSGSITLLVHLLINTYYHIIKKYPQRAASFIIILGIATVVFFNGRTAVTNSWENNTVKMVREITYKCLPVEQNSVDKKVVLRLDDIQAHAYTEISKKIITDTTNHNMKLVLGVIPYNFPLDKPINKVLKKNSCNLELALHGWDHFLSQETEEYEFEDMKEAEAASKIRDGKKILEQIDGQPVITFIPPGNLISDETKKVLDDEGIKYLSGDSQSSVYGLDATTFDFQNNKLIDNEEILKRCDEKFSQNKFCVIVLHPQDYLTDDKIDLEKYGKYINLLEELRNQQIESITFRDL